MLFNISTPSTIKLTFQLSSNFSNVNKKPITKPLPVYLYTDFTNPLFMTVFLSTESILFVLLISSYVIALVKCGMSSEDIP